LSLITLITDFGIKDGNVGVMKGVIWSLAPDSQIADLSHSISPQNIREAALILSRAVPYFPAGTIHVAVVDPGVGTSRRPMAAQLGNQLFVLPDNGLLSLVLEQNERSGLPGKFIHLDRPQFWLAKVSHVFHGRDIFAPAAGHLASGIPIDQLGSPFTDPIRLSFPQPQKTLNGLQGEVIHIDHFGNISSNIRQEHLKNEREITVNFGKVRIQGLVHTFAEKPPGTLVALYGSTGNLIVCVVNGNAAQQLNASLGDIITVSMSDPTPQ
jgi:S-adenosylmethionine hydrolase